jgi:hypothetical protein
MRCGEIGKSAVPRLSIIIPTLGDWEALETTLVSVLENRPPNSEIVVVVNPLYNDPYDLKDEVRFVPALGRSRLVDLINIGFAAARAEVVHVLACGATVADGWTAAVLRLFDDVQVAAVAPVVLDATRPSRVLTAGCTWSSRGQWSSYGADMAVEEIDKVSQHWIGPDLAAAFYRRSALAEVGGLDATLPPALAAVDLGLQFTACERRCVLETGCQVALEGGRLCSDRPWRHAWHGERLFWRYARRHGWLRGLCAHGWAIIEETIRSAPQFSMAPRWAGRALGLCDRRRRRRAIIESRAAPEAKPQTNETSRRVDPQHDLKSPRRQPISVLPDYSPNLVIGGHTARH